MLWEWVDTFRTTLAGKKTYITAMVMILHAVSHYFLDPSQQGVDTKELLEGLSLMFMRAGIAKSGA
jgi:hypothetical protein